MTDIRTVLDQLIRDRGESYDAMSRLLGRNPAYIQQFIRRGVPRKLDEEDRATLARYLGVDEGVLGGRSGSAPVADPDLVRIRRLAVSASAGPGSLADREDSAGSFAVDKGWLRRLGARSNRLSMIQVQGDSMVPTLTHGDDILVDEGDGGDRARDGIYVLRIDDEVYVKRLAVDPFTRRYAIISDNRDYPVWQDCDPANVHLVGRVIWTGRRLG
jgi:phage repressor protein C with HTH and peptisase S24 domain